MDREELYDTIRTAFYQGESLPKDGGRRTTLTFTLSRDQHRAIELLAWALDGQDKYGARVDRGSVVRLALAGLAELMGTTEAGDLQVSEIGQRILSSLGCVVGREPPLPKTRKRGTKND